jgi:hypothetical protein
MNKSFIFDQFVFGAGVTYLAFATAFFSGCWTVETGWTDAAFALSPARAIPAASMIAIPSARYAIRRTPLGHL